MFNMIGQIVSSALGLTGSLVNTAQVNKTNLNIAGKTNEANRQMVEMQNKAAAAESEKAYQRSKATTQVTNMMQAGMSRAGAINALNGGGSYTPAPVNTSQDSAPQMQTTDLSALANIGQAFAQRAQQKHDEKMQAKQIAAQKDEAQKQREHELLLKDIDTANQTQRDYLEYTMRERELQLKSNDFEFRKEQYKDTAAQIKENTNYTKAQRLQLEALFEEWQSEPAFSARQAKYQMEKIAAVFDYRINEKDMQAYLDSYFEKNSNGEYVPIRGASLGGIEAATELVDKVWSLIFTIVPVKTVLESIRLFGA